MPSFNSESLAPVRKVPASSAVGPDDGMGGPPGALDAQDVQALLLELAPETRFVFGDVDPLHDLPSGGAEPAAEFHAVSVEIGARSCL